jgi:hypothetical protein
MEYFVLRVSADAQAAIAIDKAVVAAQVDKNQHLQRAYKEQAMSKAEAVRETETQVRKTINALHTALLKRECAERIDQQEGPCPPNEEKGTKRPRSNHDGGDAPVAAADKEWVPPAEEELQQMKKELNDLKQSRIVTTSHTGATGMATYTMEQLLHPDPDKPTLYVPEEHKERIRRIYGGMTFGDFDELFDFNAKIGAPYSSCFKSMMYWMNEVEGDLHDQHAKLAHSRPLSDVFNIVQSAVRSRIGEKVWY